MIQFFLRRSAFTNFATLILIVLGVFHFTTVKREAFPDVRFDIVTILTVYPGASPQEVERFITTPIEDMLRGINNISHVESYSTASRSIIVLRLDEGLEDRQIDRVVTDIQQATNRVRDLPAESDRPIVSEMTSDRPLISLSILGGTVETRNRAAEDLTDAFEDLAEVSRVIQDGKPPREIWVEADPAKLAGMDISLMDISRSIAASNVNLTAGTLTSGSRELVVRALGGLWTATDVQNVIIKGNDDREFIRVRDVAHVRETFEDTNYILRVNQEPAISLQVTKRKEADAIDLTRRVRSVKESFAPGLAKLGITLVESDDISFFIKRRLKVMKNNMALGAILIMGAMLLFLNWRLAFVASLGIGVSLASAFAIGVPMGMSLNLLTMMAFIIVLGMLNDDAIVVTDNIYRHLQMGKSPMEAATDGTLEVVKPVLGAILTSCVAFLPFAMMTGIMGKFLIVFPTIVILCLTVSMLEAFFILPAHVLEIARFGGTFRQDTPPKWFAFVLERYRRSLTWSLSHRGASAIIALGLIITTILLAYWRLNVSMFPSGMIDQFVVKIEMDTGTTLHKTDAALKTIEKAVATLPPEELECQIGTTGMVGYEHMIKRGTHYGQSRVFLTPQEYRERQTEDIIDSLRKQVGDIPGVRTLTFEVLKPGPPVGAPFMARIRGNDLATLVKIAKEYTDVLRETAGVKEIRSSFEEGKDELIITPRSENLAYVGLDAATVSHNLVSAFQGMEATKIRRPNEEVVVRVKLSEATRRPNAIKQLLVANRTGKPVPLEQLVTLETGHGQEYIAHYNFRQALTVTAHVDIKEITSHQLNRMMQERFEDVSERYPGYEAIYGGEEEETQKSFESLKSAFIIAILINIAILMALFESWSQPFLILLTIPIGLMGATYALILHNEPISLMALLGAVAMTGVVVNNSIVLLDFVNRLRAQGMPLHKALVEAGAVRLRPIFASSLTTLLCLFPTAYGLGGREPFVQPLALSMAWGLTFATPLTLFVIPMAYSLTEDAGIWFRTRFPVLIANFISWMTGRSRRRPRGR